MTRRDPDDASPDDADDVTIDLDRRELLVHVEGGGDVAVAIAEHRVDVLRRLLDRGLSSGTLVALFPGWRELIDAVSRPAEDQTR